MNPFSQVPQISQRFALPSKRGLSSQVIILFILLTLGLTATVIVAWEKILRPPYYRWVELNYPGLENAENRYKIEQRGEHFFISMAVDLIVVSMLLALIDRKQRKLAAAQERLAQSERVAILGKVAAQVAHEVRNPLAGLLLYSMHLRSKVSPKFSESDAQIMDKIIETINGLTSTTEQILNFARPLRLEIKSVDINRMITDVVQLLTAQITANRIETTLVLSDSAVTGMLDEASLRAASLNLVLNAVQAMPDGGRLEITTGSSGEKLWIVISDTGSGMSAEELEQIFEPFHSTKSRGLGLGMPYAQRVIEQHGGAILVESEPGVGTKVKVELPAKRGVMQ